eukprot:15434112-Alexandrium_andersonii.AAC.1
MSSRDPSGDAKGPSKRSVSFDKAAGSDGWKSAKSKTKRRRERQKRRRSRPRSAPTDDRTGVDGKR